MTIQPNLYGVVHTKTPREVVLLNSVGGCSWSRCAFCEYHDTYSRTAYEATQLNKSVLKHVTGIYPTLQIVCSASFIELPAATWYDILDTCKNNNINHIIIEMHWIHRNELVHIKQFYEQADIEVESIFGVETFDFYRREVEWFKGYGKITPEELAEYADDINLLVGVKGETMESIEKDVDIALKYFKKVTLMMFEPNDTPIERDYELVDTFYKSDLFKKLCNMSNVEIMDGLDRRAPDNLGYVGVGPH